MPEKKAPVITFYSYKGGTGRSLAITQMAACLAHFGRNVVLIDLDLDSPSLHHKLSFLGPWVDDGKSPTRGLVDMLRLGVQSARDLRYIETCRVCGRPGVLAGERTEPFLDLPPDQPVTLRPPRGTGSISFLASGLPTDQTIICKHNASSMRPIWRYWETLYNPETQTLFNYSTEFEVAFRCLIEQLRKRETDPPDYILIDSSSGNSPLSHVSTRILPDKLVAFTGNQQDSVAGTAMMLSRMISPDLDVYVAISKIPGEYRDHFQDLHSLGEEEVRHLKEDIKQTILRANSEIPPDRFFLLHLDPFLAYREQLPIPLTQERHTTRTALVEDYLDLFCALLAEEDKGPFRKHFQEHLKADLEEIRLFHLFRETGLLINPSDDSRNVAMRADTLGQLMQTLAAQTHDVGEKLHEAGLRAAERFTEALVDLWDKHVETKDLTILEQLEKWCEFDSTVGFGRFSFAEGSSETEGTIELRENFLLYNRTPKDLNLCPFWIGYLTTVLRGITKNAAIDVEHPKKACGQYHPDLGHSCQFIYKSRELSPGSERDPEA